MTSIAETVSRLLRQLPDPRTAELLFNALLAEQKSLEGVFQREPALLSDVLTVAAWSPLLAATLENNPEYVTWLQRERAITRVRTREELGESLGRFALINSQLDPHVMLARFRRRELLRTYLHDIRRTRTIVETTDELSSLADAVLEYALKLCRQELDNRYGSPQTVDAQSRISSAEFCIVALGKLGSGELNYASDIDLVFLFSDEGLTSAGASRGQITNREYFVKLAERLLRLVGEPTGEGASYRIDARLRPHGREGALASSINEAVNYYQRAAQDWELQALIRSRSAAGSDRLFSQFARLIQDQVYRANIGVADALAHVRTAKDKIDRQSERAEKGYNVKLGRGGIREIEFIAQALQLAFGGDDPWLRTPHTLITLGRLAERALINEREHSQLSDAYHFLRTLEHRLQMEHGLQTHSVPNEPARRELVARRMNFSGESALVDFEAALHLHTGNVHAAFDRVFGEGEMNRVTVPRPATVDSAIVNPKAEIARTAAAVFIRRMKMDEEGHSIDRIAATLEAESAASINPSRAMSFINRIAASLNNDDESVCIGEQQLPALAHICGASEFFGEMIAARPSLIQALPGTQSVSPSEYQTNDVDLSPGEGSFGSELDQLRRNWSRLLLRIGVLDAAGALTLSQVNKSLTDLAKSGTDASLVIAAREFERRYGKMATLPRMAIMALGRFGSGGVDYGSDLDVVIVYDGATSPHVSGLTESEVNIRLTEYLVTALSSTTHGGYLYRVDLRLRPDGQKGPLATSAEAFMNYLERRAGIWEWLAYVKLRAVAGDSDFGVEIENSARRLIHEMARKTPAPDLAREARRVRDRLEKEKSSPRHRGLNIKHGRGGMLDVYFATRYLQLRDDVPDDDEDRTTPTMLQRLRDNGSINEENFAKMFAGYRLLRAVDHQLRLIVGRSAVLPPPESAAYREIAGRLDYETADSLADDLVHHMMEIREAYDSMMQNE